VVETVTVDIKSFAEVDVTFAYDYGEWDRTLESPLLGVQCTALSRRRESTDARDAAGL